MEPVNVFISYAHEDESYKDEMIKSLANLQRQNFVSTWVDRMIPPGDEWDKQINTALNEADIILLLISRDFIASKYCFDVEVKRAIERHNDPEDNARVVPIIARFADWHETPFAKLQALPTGARPIKNWDDKDQAYYDIVKQLKKVIKDMRGEGTKDPVDIPQAIPHAQPAAGGGSPVDQFRDLISQGKTKKAIDLMIDHYKNRDADIYNQFILMSSRNKSLEKQEMMGVLDARTAQVQRAQINYALLQIIEDL